MVDWLQQEVVTTKSNKGMLDRFAQKVDRVVLEATRNKEEVFKTFLEDK